MELEGEGCEDQLLWVLDDDVLVLNMLGVELIALLPNQNKYASNPGI
jgi:hypothetical protein